MVWDFVGELVSVSDWLTERDMLDVPESEADPVGDDDNVADAVAVSVGDEVAVPEVVDVTL